KHVPLACPFHVPSMSMQLRPEHWDRTGEHPVIQYLTNIPERVPRSSMSAVHVHVMYLHLGVVGEPCISWTARPGQGAPYRPSLSTHGHVRRSETLRYSESGGSGGNAASFIMSQRAQSYVLRRGIRRCTSFIALHILYIESDLLRLGRKNTSNP